MEGNLLSSEDDDAFLVKEKPQLMMGQANESGCFDCNICLDTACDPVVTLCGHLFCWPCIYRWLHVHLSSVPIHKDCPVCKSNIAISSLVPLYGRGMSSTFPSNKHLSRIPRRPAPSSVPSQPSPLQYSPRAFTTTESTDLANAVIMSFLYPVIGMFGDMVYTRVFGTFTNTIAQPYQSHRMMQRDKSLNRVSIFFLCCIVLCLLLF